MEPTCGIHFSSWISPFRQIFYFLHGWVILLLRWFSLFFLTFFFTLFSALSSSASTQQKKAGNVIYKCASYTPTSSARYAKPPMKH
mmetsp:Transcript_2187/g.3880  ORF Transcript_2187/g.3880 Transcript_2187/m.3880 type:complete len:86 (+) Transcript_2187:1623-1880(+)